VSGGRHLSRRVALSTREVAYDVLGAGAAREFLLEARDGASRPA